MKRPFVHINCASTLDGKIARPDGSRLRISNEKDMKRVHELRAELGAILVGSGTILSDDPKLTVKEEYVTDPPELTKIVLDGRGRVPSSSRFLRTSGSSIIAAGNDCSKRWLDEITAAIEDEELDAQILLMDTENGGFDTAELMYELLSMGIEKLLVEGGSSTIWNFISNDIFDRFTIYIGPMMIGGNGPTVMGGRGYKKGTFDLELVSVESYVDGGILLDYIPSRDQ